MGSLSSEQLVNMAATTANTDGMKYLSFIILCLYLLILLLLHFRDDDGTGELLIVHIHIVNTTLRIEHKAGSGNTILVD